MSGSSRSFQDRPTDAGFVSGQGVRVMSLGLSTSTLPVQKSLKDATLKEHLQQLRRTDNFTNLYYLLRTYLFLVVVIGGAIGVDLYRPPQGWSILWRAPVVLPAILLVR